MSNKTNNQKGFGKIEAVVIILAIIFIILRFLSGAHSSNDSEVNSISEEPNLTQIESETNEEDEGRLSIKTGEVYNDNDVRITITGAEEKNDSIDVSFLFENSSELDLSFNAHAYSVNGIMTDNNIYDMDTTLPAGKKANSTLKLPKSVMETAGIDSNDFIYADVLFWAYDDSINYKAFETNIIRIEVEQYEHGNIEYENPLKCYDKDGIEVGLMDISGDTVRFSVVNNNDYYITFDLAAVSVNGFGFDTGIQVSDKMLFPASISVCEFTIDDDFKDSNEINDIKKAEFKIQYRPIGDYSKEKTTDSIIIE